jgi:hypothetical protein
MTLARSSKWMHELVSHEGLTSLASIGATIVLDRWRLADCVVLRSWSPTLARQIGAAAPSPGRLG